MHCDLADASLAATLLPAGQYCARTKTPEHAMHAATAACCMLQLFCLVVQLAVDQQLEVTNYGSSMAQCLERCKALRQAGVPAQDDRMMNLKRLFSTTKQLLEVMPWHAMS